MSETTTESFDLELGFSKSRDQVKVTFEYPTGRAISAIYAISKLGDYIPGLLDTLSDDPSVEAALEGYALAYEEGLDEDE